MAAPATPKQAKTQKKAGKKTPSDHPSYDVMIVQAIKALNDKKGSSRQAIVKYIKGNHKVPDKFEGRITLALKRMERKGALGHTKGSGASGSFRVTEAKTRKPAKKPPAKKPKKVKKPVAAKKSAKPKSAKKIKSPVKSKSKKKSAAKQVNKSVTKTSKKAAPSPKKATPSKTKKPSPKKKLPSKKGKKAAKPKK